MGRYRCNDPGLRRRAAAWWVAAALGLAGCGGGGGDASIPAFDSPGGVVVADLDGDGLDDGERLEETLRHAMLAALRLALRRVDQLEARLDRYTATGTDLDGAVSLLVTPPAGTA